jgi:hypothetical protein
MGSIAWKAFNAKTVYNVTFGLSEIGDLITVEDDGKEKRAGFQYEPCP